MAVICKKCGGVVPDYMLGGEDRNDCKNHHKPKSDIPGRGRNGLGQ